MAEAERLYKRSISILEQALGADHPGLQIALNGLAMVYQTQGRKNEAESVHQRAIRVSAPHRSRGSPVVLRQRSR